MSILRPIELNRTNLIYAMVYFICHICQEYVTLIIVFSGGKSIRNKMPILAFTRAAVPDLFPFYASQIFKAILHSQLKYCVTVLEIIPEMSF